jgi:uncharacterized repeat protein (TIGR03843 family)
MNKTKLIDRLRKGQLELVGQFVYGSNAVFLVELDCNGERIEAVYKPLAGERPLWDFPPESLAGREVAAHLLSEALGWGLVPPTVWRAAGPAGPGSLQVRVAHNPEEHYFTFSEAQREALRPAALFDLLANNADRKGGHMFFDAAGELCLIDHGLCFHAEPKLRTVVWDFVGEEIPAELLKDLERLRGKIARLREKLSAYLTGEELDALEERLAALLADRRFPGPPEGVRAMPWPVV